VTLPAAPSPAGLANPARTRSPHAPARPKDRRLDRQDTPPVFVRLKSYTSPAGKMYDFGKSRHAGHPIWNNTDHDL
jgi:hypothetical protein